MFWHTILHSFLKFYLTFFLASYLASILTYFLEYTIFWSCLAMSLGWECFYLRGSMPMAWISPKCWFHMFAITIDTPKWPGPEFESRSWKVFWVLKNRILAQGLKKDVGGRFRYAVGLQSWVNSIIFFLNHPFWGTPMESSTLTLSSLSLYLRAFGSIPRPCTVLSLWYGEASPVQWVRHNEPWKCVDNIHVCWIFPNSCKSNHDLNHVFLHEGEHRKARSRPRFFARESTKKHDFLHEGERQTAWSRPRTFTRREPKSTIFCTKESTQNKACPT